MSEASEAERQWLTILREVSVGCCGGAVFDGMRC